MRECATHTFGADGRGHVAPPQRHVEIGVLATQELKANQATDGARAERPEKQWFSGAVEADDDKWLYTRIRPDMTLPLLVEVIILVGRGETVAASSERQCGSTAAMSSKISTRAIRRSAARRLRPPACRERIETTFMGCAGPADNAPTSQRFLNKELE